MDSCSARKAGSSRLAMTLYSGSSLKKTLRLPKVGVRGISGKASDIPKEGLDLSADFLGDSLDRLGVSESCPGFFVDISATSTCSQLFTCSRRDTS